MLGRLYETKRYYIKKQIELSLSDRRVSSRSLWETPVPESLAKLILERKITSWELKKKKKKQIKDNSSVKLSGASSSSDCAVFSVSGSQHALQPGVEKTGRVEEEVTLSSRQVWGSVF